MLFGNFLRNRNQDLVSTLIRSLHFSRCEFAHIHGHTTMEESNRPTVKVFKADRLLVVNAPTTTMWQSYQAS